MANIIIPKYRETILEQHTHVQGHWKVEVVHANGEVSQPFGDKMMPNLIQDSGLKMLAGFAPSSVGNNHANFYSIADLINCAIYTSSSANPNSTNYSTAPAGTTSTAYSTRNTTNNCTVTPHSDGYTYTKVWDFQAITAGTNTVREICIAHLDNNGNQDTDYGTSAAGLPISGYYAIFSRFILPSSILLETYQFLRLTYSLKVSIPAIVTPIEVPNIVSGTFSGLGKLKLLGEFNNIFGGMTAAGVRVPAYYRRTCTSYGCSPDVQQRCPWNIIGPEWSSGGLVATLFSASDLLGNDSVNFSSFNPGDSFFNTQNTVAPTVGNAAFSNGLGGSASTEAYTAGSNSASRIATVFFPATNPSTTQFIAGIGFSNHLEEPQYSAGRPVNQRHMWVYKFFGPDGNQRAMEKDVNYALRISVRSVVTR